MKRVLLDGRTKNMISNLNEQQDFTRTSPIRWDSSWPESAKDDRPEFFSYLEERFGISPSVFDEYLLLKRNKSWWFLRQSDLVEKASSLRVCMTGLKAFQMVGRYIKPTTRLIQVFGHLATRSILPISSDDIKKMIDVQYISSDMKIDNGYIILCFRNASLGLGLFIDGKVISQIPRRDLILFVQ